MRLFGSSGIRRVFDADLAHLTFKVGLAVGKIYGNVVVGSDTRTSSSALKHSVISGLLTVGASCSDAGLTPTPTLALATREFNAGIMVTASHNPPEYNGIKLWNPDGSSFSDSQQEQIEDFILSETINATPWKEIKQCSSYDGAVKRHIERISQEFPRKCGLRVVVDSGGGAASKVTTNLLKRMGCDVLSLNDKPTGFFPRAVEPVESNLVNLIQLTRESGALLGIAHDGDADRMMAVERNGRFISGDRLLAIFARSIQAVDIVTTVDASMAIDEMGFIVRRTRVGDIYVSNELKNGGEFGGEPSGSWVFPSISLCPDGIYAAAMITHIASHQNFSELINSIPSYPLLRGSFGIQGAVISRLESQLMELHPLSVSNTDGMKLDFGDGWLLVRPSGTEPKIRLTVEARNEQRAQEIYDRGQTAIKEAIAGKERNN